MMGESGVDYPEEKMPVDVRAESRGDTLLSFVELVENGELVLSVGQDRQRRPVRLDRGEHLELMWRGPDELRAMPAELLAVETGGQPRWRVRPVGPAARGQRRAAVRAPLDFRVTLAEGPRTLGGVSVDLSEGGMRCLLDDRERDDAGKATGDNGAADEAAPEAKPDAPAGPRLEIGSVQQVTIWVDEHDQLITKGEIVRHFPREDRREEVSVRFIGLPEKMEDLIRGRVFARLRDLRARGML